MCILKWLCKNIFRFSKYALHILKAYYIFKHNYFSFYKPIYYEIVCVWGKTKALITMCWQYVIITTNLIKFWVYKVVLGKQFGNYSWQRLLESFQTSEAWATYSDFRLNVTVNFISNSNSHFCFFPQHFTGSYKHADLIFVYIFLIDLPWR